MTKKLFDSNSNVFHYIKINYLRKGIIKNGEKMVKKKITSVTQKMIEYFGNDVKRINHSLKVLSFAKIMVENLLLEKNTIDVTLYSALLHDIGIKEAEKKYSSSAGKYQEAEGPAIAEKILKELNIPLETINRVCYIIGSHHSYDKIDGVDFQILVESDFLVNIFEDDFNRDSIEHIYKRIFKTEEGKKLVEVMYLNKK